MYAYLGIDSGSEYAAVLHTGAVPSPLLWLEEYHGRQATQ
jgi:hypothetical protein